MRAIDDGPLTLPMQTNSSYQLKSDRYSSHSVILSRLTEGKDRSLLDVGAAEGYLAELLTTRGYEVTCIEGNPSWAALASGKCRSMIVVDLNKEVPRLEKCFDVIVYGDVLEHLLDPLKVLNELNHSLKFGGVVVISVPNVAHIWIRTLLLFGRFEYTDRGILDRTHLRFFTLHSLFDFVKEAGLRVEELLVTPVPLPLIVPQRHQKGIFHAVHAFSAALARGWKTMFAYQFVAFCRREAT